LPWMTSKNYFLLILFSTSVFLRKTADEKHITRKKNSEAAFENLFFVQYLKNLLFCRENIQGKIIQQKISFRVTSKTYCLFTRKLIFCLIFFSLDVFSAVQRV
jgi:hypothetical protein